MSPPEGGAGRFPFPLTIFRGCGHLSHRFVAPMTRRRRAATGVGDVFAHEGVRGRTNKQVGCPVGRVGVAVT